MNLKAADMRFLLAALLTTQGYRAAGTTLIGEHGTAQIQEHIRRILWDSTHAITCADGKIEDAPAMLGWYSGPKKGNFRIKASLESLHNLAHNATAMIPGQIGSNQRLNAPEELTGRLRENASLMKLLDRMPAEKAAMLSWPFLHFHQAMEILADVYRWIDGRTEHDLEGWEEADLVTGQYRLDLKDDRWLPASTLDGMEPEKRLAVQAIIERPGHFGLRRLSPQEVWARRSLVRLPMSVVPDLLGPDLAEPRRVQDKAPYAGTIAFQDRRLDAAPILYRSLAVNQFGDQIVLKPGETYNTFANPFAMGQMIVCDARGRYIGTCSRIVRACKADTGQLHRAMGDAAHAEEVALRDYRARHVEDVESLEAERRQNRLIASGAPVLKEEIATEAAVAEASVTRGDWEAATQVERGAGDEHTLSDEEASSLIEALRAN